MCYRVPNTPANINALSSTAPLSKPNQFKYNGKELESAFSLGWYDYGARMFDPTIARWNGVDASAENYINQSPYHYAGNNPIIFVDYDGNDYGLKVNHDTKTVTISATYYVKKGDREALTSARNAVKSWNDKSGDFVYRVGKKDNREDYNVSVSLNVVEVEDPREAFSKAQ